MEEKIFFFIFCSVLTYLGQTRAESSCTTPDQKTGVCVLVRECPKLLQMIYNYGALSYADQEFVRRSQCARIGATTMVCCELKVFKESDFPMPGQCGTQVKERIHGGEETNIQDYPWMALIQFTRDGKHPQYACGGSLINNDYVLTAAHCVTGRRLLASGNRPTAVRLGEHNLLTERDCEDDSPLDCADPVIDVAIYKTIHHESYDEHLSAHDIALIRLEHSITFTDWVKPICLPFAPHLRNKNYDNVTLSVAGFGRTENGTSSDVKLKVDIDGYNWNRCNNKYRRTLISSQLCAGGEAGKDSCKGDSGGPLMGDDKTNNRLPYTYLVGIVSRGPPECGTDDYPGIYTKVDQYLEWIMQHMKH